MRTLAAVVLVALAALPASGVTPRQCRKACRDLIQACVDGGGRRRACRTQLVRRCRKEGPGTCGTTTTIPGGGATTTTLRSAGAVNGCDPAQAADVRGQANVTVRFVSFNYTPECMAVTAGTRVTFAGDFSFHPLVGGEIVGSTMRPDASSPFMPRTVTGSSRSFTLSTPGTYPYYCDFHGVSNQMRGAVVVVP